MPPLQSCFIPPPPPSAPSGCTPHSTARTRPRPPTRAPFFERDLRPSSSATNPRFRPSKVVKHVAQPRAKVQGLYSKHRRFKGRRGVALGQALLRGIQGWHSGCAPDPEHARLLSCAHRPCDLAAGGTGANCRRRAEHCCRSQGESVEEHGLLRLRHQRARGARGECDP